MPSQQLTQLPFVLEAKTDAGSVRCFDDPDFATKASANVELLLLTVSEGSAAWMGYHAMIGSPTFVSPSESVPLLAGRMAFAVPVSMTVVGEKVPPAEMLSRPSRTPGCDGAKL